MQAHIGILHAGYTNITDDLLKGNYAFDSMLDNAMLEMSMYSAMHGYTYMRFAFEEPRDRFWGFGKAAAIKQAIKHVDLLVVVDFDVSFMDPTVPLEDMMLRWGFNSAHHLVMAAEDPDRPINKWTIIENGNESTHLNLNIGFMALRNHPKVLESLDVWSNCVDVIPDCEQFRGGAFPDQTAWNRFALPMFAADEVTRVPCNEANGYDPEWADNFGCEGIHVHHVWYPKHRLFELVKSRLLQESFKQTFYAMFLFPAADVNFLGS